MASAKKKKKISLNPEKKKKKTLSAAALTAPKKKSGKVVQMSALKKKPKVETKGPRRRAIHEGALYKTLVRLPERMGPALAQAAYDKNQSINAFIEDTLSAVLPRPRRANG